MNDLIETTFANFNVNGVDIPVSFLRYNGNANTYITYMEMKKDDSFSADNELLAYASYYDFDIYSKGNYLSVIESVKEKLKEVGFIYQPTLESEDMKEVDTGFYHKTLCFAIPIYLESEE